MSGDKLIELRDVSKRFARAPDMAARIARLFGSRGQAQAVHAVDHVTLAIAPGEVVGLVGESGSGKSTLGRIAVGLLAPSEGQVIWRGEDVAAMDGRRRREKQLATQMVFQDPYASLNPRMRIADIIGEAPVAHGIIRASEKNDYAAQLLRQVGLEPAMLRRFPHQFSGGQRARIGIARALAVRPAFLVCDEAVAALDVSVQAQVLNLFMRLRAELNLTCLFISHDLQVIRHVADRVAVMYLGRMVESAPVEQLFSHPNHPYTRTLLDSTPSLDGGKKAYADVAGETPSPLQPPSGCPFHTRCPQAMPRCRGEMPGFREVGPGHGSACHLNEGSE